MKSSIGSKKNVDILIGIVMLVLSVAAGAYAQRFPEAAQRFPVMSTVLIGFLSVLLILRAFLRKQGEEAIISLKSAKYAIATFAMTGCYILAIDVINFFVATAIFVPGMMLFMRVRKPVLIVLSTVGVMAFCWFMFVYQLNIRLP